MAYSAQRGPGPCHGFAEHPFGHAVSDGLNRVDMRIKRLVFFYRVSFEQRTVDVRISYMDVPPKPKDFGADLFLETIDKRIGTDHDGHAEGNRYDCNPDDQPRKRGLASSCHPLGYEIREIHMRPKITDSSTNPVPNGSSDTSTGLPVRLQSLFILCRSRLQ